MKKQQFIETMQRPDLLNEQTLEQIREVIDEYPFFQAGRMLWVKNLHLLDHIRYNNELKLAAAHISDRSRLFDLIYYFGQSSDRKHLPAEEPTSKPEGGTLSVGSDDIAPGVERETTDEYFEVDDVIETSMGALVDFSEKSQDEEVEIRSAFPGRADHMVLPSADLLGYEIHDTSGYQLEKHTSDQINDESRTFYDWLNLLKQQPVNKPDEKPDREVQESGKNKKMALIDGFLERADSKRIKVEAKDSGTVQNEDFSIRSLRENSDIMTETLANIYIGQKHFFKAIDIFEQLRLKYPEKNIYFARRIKELEEQINNQ